MFGRRIGLPVTAWVCYQSSMPRSGRRAASTAALLKRVLASPSYRGKHVILLRGKVYTAASGRELTRLFDRLVKEHPGATPTLAYVPTAQTLVLILLRAESGRSAASAAGVPASA